ERSQVRVQLGNAFVEPRRELQARMPGHEVHVLMDRDLRRLLARAAQYDVIAVRLAEVVGRSKLVETIGSILFLRSKHDHVHRHRLGRLTLVYLEEEIAHSLEIAQRVARLPLSGAGIRLEIRRLHVNPLTLGIHFSTATKCGDYQPFQVDHVAHSITIGCRPEDAKKNATVVFLRPLSIIHVDTEETWRGGQESLLTLARGLRVRGLRQAILCPPASALAERARADGFPIEPFGLRAADIVHAHSGRAQTLAFWKTFGSRARRVVTRHVAFKPRHPWLHRVKYTRTCHGIIAVSEAVRRGLVESGVPAEQIEVIHTGVAIPELVSREHTGSEFVIGHMGAFTKEKGQDVAIAAASLLRQSLPHAKFILAGEGPLLNEIRRRAPENVSFPGFVPDRSAFFTALDLFVMPSRSEAW